MHGLHARSPPRAHRVVGAHASSFRVSAAPAAAALVTLALGLASFSLAGEQLWQPRQQAATAQLETLAAAPARGSPAAARPLNGSAHAFVHAGSRTICSAALGVAPSQQCAHQPLASCPPAGLYSNHPDLSPRYASVLLGITNTTGALPGIVGVATTGGQRYTAGAPRRMDCMGLSFAAQGWGASMRCIANRYCPHAVTVHMRKGACLPGGAARLTRECARH